MADPIESDAPARVAGFDANDLWHDPGNGQFAKPGWSTAKSLALGAVRDTARELARDKPDGAEVTVKSGLAKLGIPDGGRTRVWYRSDTHGIVRDRDGRQHVVPWSTFSDTPPMAESLSKRVDPTLDFGPPPAPVRLVEESLFNTDFGFAPTDAPTLFDQPDGWGDLAPQTPDAPDIPSAPDPVADGEYKVGQAIMPADVVNLPENAKFKVYWIADDPTATTEYRRGPDGKFYDTSVEYDQYGEDPESFVDYITPYEGGPERKIEITDMGGARFAATPEQVQTVLDAMKTDSPGDGIGNWMFYRSDDPDNPSPEDRERSLLLVGDAARTDDMSQPTRSVMFTTSANGMPRGVYSSESVEELGASLESPFTYPPVENPFVIVPLDSPEYVALAQASQQWFAADTFRNIERDYLSGIEPDMPEYMGAFSWGANSMKERSGRLINEAFGDNDEASFSYDPATGDFTPASPGAAGAVTLSRSATPWMYAREKDGATRIRIDNRTKNDVLGLATDWSVVDDSSQPYETRVAALAEQRRVTMAMMPGGASSPLTWFPDEHTTEEGVTKTPRTRAGVPSAADEDAKESLARLTALGDRIANLITETAEAKDPNTGPNPYGLPLDTSEQMANTLHKAASKVDKSKLGGTQSAQYDSVMWALGRVYRGGNGSTQVTDLRIDDDGSMLIVFDADQAPNSTLVGSKMTITLSADGEMTTAFVAGGVPKSSGKFQFDPETTAGLRQAVDDIRRIDDEAAPLATPVTVSPRLAAHRKVFTDLGIDMTSDEQMTVGARGALADLAPDDPIGVTLRAGLAPYPRSWTNALKDFWVNVDIVKADGEGANGTDLNERSIVLKVPDTAAAPWYSDIVGHEMGHTFEKVVPGVTAGQYWHMLSRMRPGETPVNKRFGRHQLTMIEDEWADPYTGRVYDDGITSNRSLEVFTTGVQSVYDLRHRPASRFEADPRLHGFTVGLLATVEPPPGPDAIQREQMSATQLLGGSYTVDDVTALLKSGSLTDTQRTDLREILNGML